MDGASCCIAGAVGCPHGRERTEPMVSPSSEPAPTQSEDSGPQQCLHISISGSSLELSEPVDSTHRELVPFDSDDTDDESSPSPSGTLQSQASHSTISSSFGSESSIFLSLISGQLRHQCDCSPLCLGFNCKLIEKELLFVC